MLRRLIAAAAVLASTAFPASALITTSLNKLPDESLAAAAARMRVKDYQGARQAALKSSDKGVAPFLRGMASLRLELWDEAASDLDLAAGSYPLLADYALYYQGVALSKLRRWDQTYPPLFKLLKEYPDSRLARPALLLYADDLAEGGYYKEALQGYSTFLERYPAGSDSISALFGSALSREKLGSPAAAADVFRGIWLRYPGSPMAAKAATELERLKSAGVKVEPYSNAELFKRASTLYDLGRSSEAAKALGALQLGGESEEFGTKVRLKTGLALLKARRYQDAREVFSALAKKTEGTSSANEANFWLAKSLQKSGKQEEAFRMYMRLADAAKVGTVADDALLEAAYLKRFQKKWGEALQLFRVFLAKHPERSNAAATWEAAWASYQTKDYQGAAEFLKKAAERDELREKALYWLAKSQSASGDSKGAEATLAKLASEFPLGYYTLICNRWCAPSQFPVVPASVTGSLPMPAGFEREKALITLGMLDDAARELSRTKKSKNPAGVARLYLEMGNYNRALHLMEQERPRLTESATLWGLNFPLAFSDEVSKNASLTGVPESLIYAIMRQESTYLPAALSPVGAVGLMQIMPSTAESITRGSSARLASPDLNILLGAKYLKDLLKAYDKDVVLTAAAYNAGQGNVKRWQQSLGGLPQDEFVESIPFRETREYVKKVLTYMELYQRLYRLPPYKR